MNQINSMLFKIILLLIIIALQILNKTGYDINSLGILILVIYLLKIYFYEPIEFINNLPFFFIILPMTIGGFFIERGVYLFEIDKIGYRNGTFLNNLFCSIIFIDMLISPIKVKRKKIKLVNVNKNLVEFIICLSVFILYIFFIKSGIPILKGIHRTIYFGSIVPYFINFIKGRLSFFCLILGYYYINFRSKRYLFYFILIILYYILCSIKGGELLLVIYTFLLPIFIYLSNTLYGDQRERMNKQVQKGLVILLLLVYLLVFVNYKTVENYNLKTTPIQKIQKRIEAAGQVWWTINDQKQIEKKIRLKEFFKNFNVQEDNINKGMNQLMSVVIPDEILKDWRMPGARSRSLANGFPAIGFYYFGWTGVFIFIFILTKMINTIV